MSPIKFSQTTVVKYASLHFTCSRHMAAAEFNDKVNNLKGNLLREIVAQGLTVTEGYENIIRKDDTGKQARDIVENIVKNSPRMPIMDVGQELQTIAGKVRARPVLEGEPGILSYLFRPRTWFKRRK